MSYACKTLNVFLSVCWKPVPSTCIPIEIAALWIFVLEAKLFPLDFYLSPQVCLSLQDNMLLSFRYSSHWFYDSVSGHSSFTAQALSSFHTWRKKVNQSKMLRWIAVACFNSCSFLVPINKLEESVCNVTVKYVGKTRCVESWALCNFGVSVISILAQQ